MAPSFSLLRFSAEPKSLSLVYHAVTLLPMLLQLLITEAPLTSARHRERLAELAFETLHVPALHVAATPTLALYGAGRTTGLVVEVGDGVTSATPIYEGEWGGRSSCCCRGRSCM